MQWGRQIVGMAEGHELQDAASWHARARTLRPGGLALIDGVLQGAQSGATFEDISPMDGRKLADVAACDAADVDAAVAAARAAFERGVWAEQAPEKRKRVLLRFAELIERATAGARAARDARYGQADSRQPPDRCARDRELPALVRRGDRQDLR